MKLEDMDLAIACPLSWPFIPSDTFVSFTAMDKPPEYTLYREECGSIEEMRERIVENAINCGHSHLFFVDYDMVYPPATLSRLAQLIGPQCKIAGGLCYRRYPPYDPILFIREDDGRLRLLKPKKYDTDTDTEFDYRFGDILRVDATGAACLLIDLEVFKNISQPWFKTVREKHEDGSIELTGEDVHFCNKAVDAGYKILVDTGLGIDHMVVWRANRNLYLLWDKLVKEGMVK